MAEQVAKLDGIKAVVVVAVLLICSSAFAQPMNTSKGTPNAEGIKPSAVQQAPTKTYDVPFVAVAEKADGTGPVEVVTYQKVTKAQLTQIITNATRQRDNMAKQITDAEAQLAKITELEKAE